jgi:hypothetical protein
VTLGDGVATGVGVAVGVGVRLGVAVGVGFGVAVGGFVVGPGEGVTATVGATVGSGVGSGVGYWPGGGVTIGGGDHGELTTPYFGATWSHTIRDNRAPKEYPVYSDRAPCDRYEMMYAFFCPSDPVNVTMPASLFTQPS